MVAVMIMLAAVISMVTSDLSTPAASATFSCKAEVSVYSVMLPLTVSRTKTVSVEGGGGEGGGGEGGTCCEQGIMLRWP